MPSAERNRVHNSTVVSHKAIGDVNDSKLVGEILDLSLLLPDKTLQLLDLLLGFGELIVAIMGLLFDGVSKSIGDSMNGVIELGTKKG